MPRNQPQAQPASTFTIWRLAGFATGLLSSTSVAGKAFSAAVGYGAGAGIDNWLAPELGKRANAVSCVSAVAAMAESGGDPTKTAIAASIGAVSTLVYDNLGPWGRLGVKLGLLYGCITLGGFAINSIVASSYLSSMGMRVAVPALLETSLASPTLFQAAGYLLKPAAVGAAAGSIPDAINKVRRFL